MRVLNNTGAIAKRAKIAQITNLAGILILGAGLVISLTKPEWSLYTLVLLVVGVISSQYGIATAYRYARRPRPDQQLADALKGLDDRYRLYNYVLPAHHVLLTPRQLHVVILRGIGGQIICEGRRWQHARRFSLRRILRIFSPEGLGNPVREAEWDRDALQEWVRRNVNGIEVEVDPLVVFLNPQVEIEERNPAVRPIRAKQLKEALRRGGGTPLGSDSYRALASAFDGAASAVGADEKGPERRRSEAKR